VRYCSDKCRAARKGQGSGPACLAVK
jgi:hypothetical protein